MRIWIIDKLARVLRVLIHIDGIPYGVATKGAHASGLPRLFESN